MSCRDANFAVNDNKVGIMTIILPQEPTRDPRSIAFKYDESVKARSAKLSQHGQKQG